MAKKIEQEIEVASPELIEVNREQKLQELAEAAELRQRAEEIARQRTSAGSWDPDRFLGSTLTLDASLKLERKEHKFLIENMLGAGHNCSISGNNGVGKTTLGLNLVRALIGHQPFLEHDTSLPKSARVVWWNGEMDPDDFNNYARPLDIASPRRVDVKHLRDMRVCLLNDSVAEVVAKDLRANNIHIWFVDSWARLCAWSGVSENKNEDVARLCARIDEVKREAGVAAFVVLAHTGRGKPDEGDEHARGATIFDDWVDARWAYVMPDPRVRERFLYTYKVRGVRDPDLIWGQEIKMDLDNVVSAGNATRGANIDRDFMADLVQTVTANPGEDTTRIAEAHGTTPQANSGRVTRHLKKAEEEGLIHVQKGRKNAKLWFPGSAEAEVLPIGTK